MTIEEKIKVMQLEEKIKVMQHYADGGEIQTKPKRGYCSYPDNAAHQDAGCDCNEWEDNTTPFWNWDSNNYRIKPKPTPQSLEDRVQCEYPEYEVKMIKDNGYGIYSHNGNTAYTAAQAYINFVSYVYEDGKELFLTCSSSMFYGSVISRPVAALFTKDSNEEA